MLLLLSREKEEKENTGKKGRRRRNRRADDAARTFVRTVGRTRAAFRRETGDFVSVTGARHFASNTGQLGGYIRLIQPRPGRSTGVTST